MMTSYDVSVKGAVWNRLPAPEAQISFLTQVRCQLSEWVAECFLRTGEDSEFFFNPLIKNSLMDPGILKDIDVAVEVMACACMRGEKIGILGDYDADGVTSVAILSLFLKEIRASFCVRFPDRFKDGYGPNKDSISYFLEQKVSVVVVVDCGTVAFEVLGFAQEQGLRVIVLDHHQPHPSQSLASGILLINPHRLDESGAFRELCGVGVVFIFLVALNRRRRSYGCLPDVSNDFLLGLTDLVSVGTICDMVPLKRLNRALVHAGLKLINGTRRRPCFSLLLKEKRGLISAEDIGFLVGPFLNAEGRLGVIDAAYRLLMSDSEEEGRKDAAILLEANKTRKNIEQNSLKEIFSQAEGWDPDLGFSYCSSENWNIGIVGILASRLKERFYKPAFVVSFSGEVGRGSARSVEGISVTQCLQEAKEEGLILTCGGHVAAAGFSLTKDQESGLYAFLFQKFKSMPALRRQFDYDGVITLSGLTVDFYQELQKLAPFGIGNREPVFRINRISLDRICWFGATKDHMRCCLSDGQGGSVVGLFFYGGYFREKLNSKSYDLLVKMRYDYNNRKIFVFIEDIKCSLW